jgi:phosphohistidine swiveling domain-containing protein
MNINDLGKDWIKFWSLKFSMFSASVLADFYIEKMEGKMGKAFYHSIIVFKDGNATCFSKIKEREEYGLECANRYVKTGKIKDYRDDLKRKTDEILNLLRSVNDKDKIEDNDILGILNKFDDYAGEYPASRALVDYAGGLLNNEMIEILKEAKLYSEPVYGLAEEVYCKYLGQIAKEEDYPENLMMFVLIKEILEYMDSGNLPEKKILGERSKGCALIVSRERYEIITDKDEVEKLSRIDEDEIKGDSVKGMKAYRGYAKGKCRIILNPFNYKEFNEGDVLVTGMTRPDFLPLMKKCSAIVTDIGGLLCHAAIVAREIGKPCVIGTKSASKVFRDGDIIEVDADKGIVRRL